MKPAIIGWMPPPPHFLFSASLLGVGRQNKTEATSGGHFPEKTMLTKPVRAESNWGPDSRHSTKSRICCGRRPSGPPAEPAGKDRMARRTSASSVTRLLSQEGDGNSSNLPDEVGCLSRRDAKVSAEGVAGLSCDVRRRTAARTFPSSSLEAIA